jgi:hypothetical protein
MRPLALILVLLAIAVLLPTLSCSEKGVGGSWVIHEYDDAGVEILIRKPVSLALGQTKTLLIMKEGHSPAVTRTADHDTHESSSLVAKFYNRDGLIKLVFKSRLNHQIVLDYALCHGTSCTSERALIPAMSETIAFSMVNDVDDSVQIQAIHAWRW